MWSLLIKVASMGKGALVVSVAASAALVSNAGLSTQIHDTPPAITAPATTTETPGLAVTPPKAPAVHNTKPTGEPKTEPKTENKPEPKTEPKNENKTEEGKGHDEDHGLIKECVEKYLALRAKGDDATVGERQSTEAVCKAALAATGLTSAEFWAKFGPHADTTAPKTEPTAAATLEHWIRECVTQYRLKTANASETCKKAIALSGLTSAEFAAKYLHLTTGGDTTPTATQKPVPPVTVAPVTNTAEAAQLIAKCQQLYAAVIAKTSTDTHAVSEACGAAARATGLTSADFWAKYMPART